VVNLGCGKLLGVGARRAIYTATVTSLDQIAYRACYAGDGEVNIGRADIGFMVLRAQP